MRNITLENIAKDLLVKEYGEEAVLIDNVLNELSKLVIKRKDIIKRLNARVTKEGKEDYWKLNEKIKKVIQGINVKLAK